MIEGRRFIFYPLNHSTSRTQLKQALGELRGCGRSSAMQ
jgi:hypothetical protein